MKSLVATISEVRDIKNYQGRLHVGGTYQNKILIFDIDDTLLVSNALIYVIKNDRTIRTLTPQQFNDYILKPGEKFDFSEFESIDSLRNSKFTDYMKTLRNEYSKGTHICILTARGDVDVIRDFFLENGIDIKPELVIAINDKRLGYSGSIAEKKSQAISALVDKGEYRTVVFFDDNKDNLKQAKQLGKQLGINVIAVHAQVHKSLRDRLADELGII